MRKLLLKSENESEKSKDAAGKPPSSISKKKSNRNHHKKKELTPAEIERKIARERVKHEIYVSISLRRSKHNPTRKKPGPSPGIFKLPT